MRNNRLGRSGPLFPRWALVSRLLAILLLCGLPAISQGRKAAPLDVQNLMSAAEVHQPGLQKLSAGEIDALNAWLSRFAARLSEGPSPSEASSTPYTCGC